MRTIRVFSLKIRTGTSPDIDRLSNLASEAPTSSVLNLDLVVHPSLRPKKLQSSEEEDDDEQHPRHG